MGAAISKPRHFHKFQSARESCASITSSDNSIVQLFLFGIFVRFLLLYLNFSEKTVENILYK